MAKSSKTENKAKHLPIAEISGVVIIGCGGTGSILAEHVCRMITGFRLRTNICLYDGDTVDQANVGRQNFYPYEIGANKAAALGLRLSGQFGANVGTYNNYITADSIDDIRNWGRAAIIVTCTDNLVSRRLVAKGYYKYWLDVGNELSHGQAVFGTTHKPKELGDVYRKFDRQNFVSDLPTIAAVNPAIFKAKKTTAPASCAEQPFRLQGFGVNAMAALAAAAILKQALVDGQVRTAAMYFNAAEGRMLPRLITKDLFEPWKGYRDGERAKRNRNSRRD